MTRGRMTLALLALGGLFLSTYLYLFKIGKIGTLACGTGGCETVQFSPQSRFLGVEVSLIGVLGYATLLLLALLALQPKYAGPSWPSRLLAAPQAVTTILLLNLGSASRRCLLVLRDHNCP